MILRFTALGEPVPKGRARAQAYISGKGKALVRMYTPGETEAYEEKLAILARSAAAGSRWVFHPKKDRFGICVKVFRPHEGAGGDADNYLKGVCDAINRAKNVWPDDRRVRDARVIVEWDPERPRVEVMVWRLGKARRVA